MTKHTVLLVDDNLELQATIKENLEEDGYAVLAVSNANELLKTLKVQRPDVILLDLILPDANGLTLIGKIREFTNAPVIVVSGKGEMVDKVVGLEMGADDYIGKPFEMRELAARIKANIRRFHDIPGATDGGQRAAAVKFGPWVLDRSRYQVFDEDGKSAELTVKEFRLLDALIRSPNQVLNREQLLDKARENNFEVFDRAIDVQITRIRKKIEEDPRNPRFLKTIRGAGYMLVTEPETDSPKSR